MAIYQLEEHQPKIASNVYVADSAQVIAKVDLHEQVSVWFNTVIRGDNEWITVARGSNIQENCVLHTDKGYPLQIGAFVTVGHQAMLHGCTIGEKTLIGIQTVIMNGAKIGAHSLIAAGSLITEGKQFPPRSLIMGSPAKVVRELTDQEILKIQESAQHYIIRAQLFKQHLKKINE